MANNTLVFFALCGTLSASVGAWVVTLAKVMWQTYEKAATEQDVVCLHMRDVRRLALHHTMYGQIQCAKHFFSPLLHIVSPILENRYHSSIREHHWHL